jgi:hypothetical protein
MVAAAGPATSTLMRAAIDVTPVVSTAENLDSTHRGLAVDVFNISGGRCRTYRQHTQGAAIDVFNSGGGRCRKSRQHPQGVCRRRLQHR